MTEFDDKDTFDIRLEEDAAGKNHVVIKINALADRELGLTSQQARVVATELIMAANRAEVRENLKRKEHLVRSGTSRVNDRRSMLQYVLQNNLISRPNWRG
ncbi:MAG: hypothetical protein ACYC4K_05125 [Thiobacillus sp.]